MEVSELRGLLAKPEWADVELKTSARAFPKDAASTLCAFANCGGGFLILGVDEKKLPVISGIDDDKLDEVQNQCLGLLKDTQKFSSPLVYDAPSLITIDGKHVLVIHIQDSKRQNKPVKLREKGNWVAYVRNGARDEEASDEELSQMLIEANCASVTEQLLELDVEQCFSENTIKWYRKVFESRHNQKYYDLKDLEFLDELGLIRENGDELLPTKAAVLMFGSEKSLNGILSRKVVDAFFHKCNSDETFPGQRWDDRRPREHETKNLFDSWRVISEKYMDWADQTFEIDETNLHRNSETPDYIGFREATVNLLVHQDFANHISVPKIDFFKDISQYWNPGDSLVDQGKIITGQSKSRNPLVMQTFHRIGLSERAGSGIREIYRSWQYLDRPDPVIENNRKEKTFQITLGKRPKVSLLQETIREKIGVKLTDLQARVFIAVLNQVTSVERAAELLNVSAADIYPAMDHLTRQGLIIGQPEGYQAQPHFADPLSDLVPETPFTEKVTNLPEKSDQPPVESTIKVTNLELTEEQITEWLNRLDETKKAKQKTLIQQLDAPVSMTQIVDMLGVKHRTNFKNNHLQVLIDEGLVAETYPDNPHHQDQAYYITEQGKVIKQALKKGG